MKNIFTIIMCPDHSLEGKSDWYDLDGNRTYWLSDLSINNIVGDIDKAAKAVGEAQFQGREGYVEVLVNGVTFEDVWCLDIETSQAEYLSFVFSKLREGAKKRKEELYAQEKARNEARNAQQENAIRERELKQLAELLKKYPQTS